VGAGGIFRRRPASTLAGPPEARRAAESRAGWERDEIAAAAICDSGMPNPKSKK